jgi:hypothetical protein
MLVGVLSHRDNEGVLDPEDDFSKADTPAQCNYDICDRELIALIKVLG